MISTGPPRNLIVFELHLTSRLVNWSEKDRRVLSGFISMLHLLLLHCNVIDKQNKIYIQIFWYFTGIHGERKPVENAAGFQILNFGEDQPRMMCTKRTNIPRL